MANRSQSVLSQLATGEGRLEEFRAVREWSKDQMRQWGSAGQERETESLALQLAARKDESIIKQLSVQLDMCVPLPLVVLEQSVS